MKVWQRWLVGLMVTGMVSAAAAAHRAPAPAPEAMRYAVRAGDTLWEVATLTAAPRVDRRERILVLQELNGLRSSTLYPGQVLIVPLGPASLKQAARAPEGFAARAVFRTSQDADTALLTASVR